MTFHSCTCSTSDGSHFLNCPFRANPVFSSPIYSMGWICPKCLAGVSPQLGICPCHHGDVRVTVTWDGASPAEDGQFHEPVTLVNRDFKVESPTPGLIELASSILLEATVQTIKSAL